MRLLSDLSVWQQLWTVTLGSPRGPPGSCLPTPQEPGCLGSELGWGHEVCSEVTELGSHPGSRLSASLPVEHFSSIEPSIPPQDAPGAQAPQLLSSHPKEPHSPPCQLPSPSSLWSSHPALVALTIGPGTCVCWVCHCHTLTL